MKSLPEILITGFPNSGTSFLCNLIVVLGKSAGSSQNLKKGDKHNRWGYFEHSKLGEVRWRAMQKILFVPWKKGFLPHRPYSFSPEKLKRFSQQIREISQKDKIEVYKDNTLPLTFKIFPKKAKYIAIKRDPEKCQVSPAKGGHSVISCSFNDFFVYYQKYDNLVKQMAREVDCIEVNYEDFFDNF